MRSVRPLLAATGLVAALALTATACGPGEDDAADKPAPRPPPPRDNGNAGIPADLADKLKEHGVDLDKWKNGEWKNWDKDNWLREAKDFVNPVIEGLWKPERMTDGQGAAEDDRRRATSRATRASPTRSRAPVQAQAEKTARTTRTRRRSARSSSTPPRARWSAPATVVKDPNHPGKSNLVWTAGHCVHAGKGGGWYRNIAFVPAYNDLGKSAGGAGERAAARRSPRTASGGRTGSRPPMQWIPGRSRPAAAGAPYDYAVMHVKPEAAAASPWRRRSASRCDVDFDAPAGRRHRQPWAPGATRRRRRSTA